MTAHLTKTKDGYLLTISASPSIRDAIFQGRVPGKREARAYAKKFNAQPWNF